MSDKLFEKILIIILIIGAISTGILVAYTFRTLQTEADYL